VERSLKNSALQSRGLIRTQNPGFPDGLSIGYPIQAGISILRKACGYLEFVGLVAMFLSWLAFTRLARLR
jgi:hypothetical protein